MKKQKAGAGAQQKFDFSPPRQRPFLASLPGKIDTYEAGVARLFQWRTGLDYYATIDQIVDFIVHTRRTKIVDLLSDTATLALRLAGRKNFAGRIDSYDSNVTLLERARQRARHLNLGQAIEFVQFADELWPVPEGLAEIAVSFFDFHRHQSASFLQQSFRMLAQDGFLLIGEVLQPRTCWGRALWAWNRIQLRLVQRNPDEARGVYYDKEDMIRMLFDTGFRQVVIQGLRSPSSAHQGVFSIVAATK